MVGGASSPPERRPAGPESATDTPTGPAEWEEQLAAPGASPELCGSLADRVHLRPLLARLPRGSRVLEAGCGLGPYVYTFVSRGHRCTGLDFSLPLLRRARARGTALAPFRGGVHWLNGTILDLPLSDRALDCYASFGVLEHFRPAQQRRILAEAARVVRPGGLLYLYVPNLWSPWTVRRAIRYRVRRSSGSGPVWQRNMSRRSVRALCSEAGFDERSCTSVYAGEALRSLAPPSRLLAAVPAPVRRGASRAATAAGAWLDRRDVGGYGLVYIGSRRSAEPAPRAGAGDAPPAPSPRGIGPR